MMKLSYQKLQRKDCLLLFKWAWSLMIRRFLGNISPNLIDKTDVFQPKQRENYWMRTLKPLNVSITICHWLDTCLITAILDVTVVGLVTMEKMLDFIFTFAFV